MQNIALNIVLNGVPQAIANLTQFEEVLAAARVQLAQLEIGSQSFKKLSAEIKTADNTLRELKKQTEGKDLEGRLGDFGKLGGAIGSSFAAATAAIQLFGNNSEDSLAAVTAAQNALTIALAARGVAEGAVVVKTVANDIATKALAASTAATNTVTKAFFATLAANPYGAIIAAVGVLITVFATLTSNTEDATKAQKEFNEALTKDIAKELSTFESLRRTIENTNLGLETRRDALDKLRTQFPKYFENLKDEDLLTGKVKIGYEQLAEAIRKAATARALEGRIATRAEKIYDLTQKEKELNDKITKAKQDQAEAQKVLISGGGSTGIGGNLIFQEGAERRVNQLVNQQKEIQSQLNALKAEDLKDSKAITGLQEKTDKVMGSIKDKEKDVTKEKEKQQIIDVRALELARLRKEEIEAQQNALSAALAFESVSEPPQLEAQQKSLAGIVATLGQLTGITESVSQKINKIFDLPTNQKDPFAGIVLNFKNIQKLANETLPITQKALGEIFGVDFTNLLTDQRKDITLFFNSILQGAKDLSKVTNDVTNQPFISAKQSLELFQDALVKAGNLQKQVNDGEITQEQKKLQLQQSILLQFFEQAKLQTQFKELSKIITDGDQERYDKFIQTDAVAKQLVGTITSGVIVLEDFREATNQSAINIAKGNQELQKTQELLKQIVLGLSPEQTGEFLQQIGLDFQSGLTYVVTNAQVLGADVTESFLKGVATMNPELDKLSTKQLKNLKSTLEIAGMELEEYGVDVEKTFEKTFKAIDKQIKQNLVNSILEGIQQFQAVLNTLSQTLSMSFSQQFDTLEKRYKRIQEGILGDSVEANQKRLDAEKAYQAERAKLEKQQAKTTLRISLAQALANTAEAITKLAAITGGVGALVAGGAVAALNAVQVGIIANQLANIDSYKRGGIFRKKQGGGFVQGPSHEYGGVKFQGGGVELEGNESIINRVSTINYMGLLDQINQSGGGKPIYPNFDDSRIVEAIAKQRSTPIRAYVVESDITAKQETARRLERLSQI